MDYAESPLKMFFLFSVFVTHRGSSYKTAKNISKNTLRDARVSAIIYMFDKR